MSESKNKGGRPHKEINQTEFEKLCALQCTLAEVCGWFGVDDMTLNGWVKRTYSEEMGRDVTFSDIFALKRGKGKVSLRRSQWKMSETNPTMAIWLGKQYLGQTDKQDVALSSNEPIKLEYVKKSDAS